MQNLAEGRKEQKKKKTNCNAHAISRQHQFPRKKMQKTTYMDTSGPKSSSSSRGSKAHLSVSLHIQRILRRPSEILDRQSQSLQRPDIRDGVRSLVGRSFSRVSRSGAAFIVRQGSVGFQCVTENIETRRDFDLTGHGAGVEGVDNSQGRA